MPSVHPSEIIFSLSTSNQALQCEGCQGQDMLPIFIFPWNFWNTDPGSSTGPCGGFKRKWRGMSGMVEKSSTSYLHFQICSYFDLLPLSPEFQKVHVSRVTGCREWGSFLVVRAWWECIWFLYPQRTWTPWSLHLPLNTQEAVCSVITTLLARFSKIKPFFGQCLEIRHFCPTVWLKPAKQRKASEAEPLPRAYFMKRFLYRRLSAYSEWSPDACLPAWFGPWVLLSCHSPLITMLWSHWASSCFWQVPNSPFSRSLSWRQLPVHNPLPSAPLFINVFSAQPPEGACLQSDPPGLCSQPSSGLPSQWGD